MKKVVFFDFFGVISSEVAPFFFRKYFSNEEADKIKNEICSLGDIGEIIEEDFYKKISERVELTPNQVAKELQGFVHINEQLVEMIKSIKQKYPVYLLSNAVSGFLRRILENNDLYQLFDKVFISSEMKIAKPNKEFFEYVLKETGVNPQDAVFVDDNPNNINGAKDCGIEGILFVGNQDFEQKFTSYFGKI